WLWYTGVGCCLVGVYGRAVLDRGLAEGHLELVDEALVVDARFDVLVGAVGVAHPQGGGAGSDVDRGERDRPVPPERLHALGDLGDVLGRRQGADRGLADRPVGVQHVHGLLGPQTLRGAGGDVGAVGGIGRRRAAVGTGPG